MRSRINPITALCLLFFGAYQQSAVALTDYVATGTLYGDRLDAFDEQGDFLDAFIGSQPFDLGSSPSFTLRFSVDETIEGRVPLFSSVVLFNDAVSNVSLDINGSPVITDPFTNTLQQFPGGNGFFPRWSFDSFPETVGVPQISVFDFDSFDFLADLVGRGMFFGLFDSSGQVYGGSSFPRDIISLDLADFDTAEIQLFWGIDDSEDPSGDPNNFGGDLNYTVYGNVETLTNLSAVPVPGAIWLMMSAVAGVGLMKRRQI